MKTVWTFEKQIQGSTIKVFAHFVKQKLHVKRPEWVLFGPWHDEVMAKVQSECTPQQLAWIAQNGIEYYE